MRKDAKNKGHDKPGTSNAIDSDDERHLEEAKEVAFSDEEGSDGEGKNEYENVLGKEADVTKGVGAMLKLAAQKGYLNDPETKKEKLVKISTICVTSQRLRLSKGNTILKTSTPKSSTA